MKRMYHLSKQHIIDQLLGTDRWLKMVGPTTGSIYYVRFIGYAYDPDRGALRSGYYKVNMLNDCYFDDCEYYDDPDLVALHLRKTYDKKHPLNFEPVEPLTVYSTEELLDCIENRVHP